jgi:NADH:ubiquinone reductase (H+-translocating)
MEQLPKVVIIGAGFGGLDAARELANKQVDVLLIDRNNFHTFTPLLYQVATSALDPSEVAYPVRSIFRNNSNVRFMLGEVEAIDYAAKQITVRTNYVARQESYDYLIVAAGSITSYFGMDHVEEYAFGLKSLSEAVVLRNHILKLFERAAWTEDEDYRDALLTIVVVGGGPTGLETSGALHELYNYVLDNEYPGLRDSNAHVILVEATDRLLLPFPEKLQKSARKQLESLGVKVIVGNPIVEVTPDHIRLKDGTVIPTYTLVWAAGVKATSVASMLDVPLGRAGRVPANPTLEVPDREHIYVIGDIAYLENDSGQPYAMLIPVAKQQGRLAAKNILRVLEELPQQSFRYRERGIMATIGRSRAVAWIFNRVQLQGYLAWIAWLGLHLLWLLGFRNRLNVLINWVWNYLTYDRSVRIILEHQPHRADQPPESEKHLDVSENGLPQSRVN